MKAKKNTTKNVIAVVLRPSFGKKMKTAQDRNLLNCDLIHNGGRVIAATIKELADIQFVEAACFQPFSTTQSNAIVALNEEYWKFVLS